MAGPNYLIGFGQRLARPISQKRGGGKTKPRGVHASKTFLRPVTYYPAEIAQRKEAHKWETVLRDESEFKPGIAALCSETAPLG